MTFFATWNEFIGPLIYLSDQRLYPLSFGLYAFQIQSLQPGTSAGVGMLMAGSLLMMLPVIVIFFFVQRYFLQGVILTGIKAQRLLVMGRRQTWHRRHCSGGL